MSHWTLFSNHGHVLLFVSHRPEARLRDIADRVGITERAVQKIVRDLQDGGLVSVIKRGRCNRYRVHGNSKLRHDLEAHCTVAELVDLIHPDDAPGTIDESPADAVSTLLEEIGTSLAEAMRDSGEEPGTTGQLAEASESAPVPQAEPEAEPEAEPTPEPPPRPEPTQAAARKKGRKAPAADDGEQGSLF